VPCALALAASSMIYPFKAVRSLMLFVILASASGPYDHGSFHVRDPCER
jgi:hypothetical protein